MNTSQSNNKSFNNMNDGYNNINNDKNINNNIQLSNQNSNSQPGKVCIYLLLKLD